MITTISRAALAVSALAVFLPAQQGSSRVGSELRLRFATFDPLIGSPEIPPALQASENTMLQIVQFADVPTQSDRDAIAGLGGHVVSYLPKNAYVVRIPADRRDRLVATAGVRWVGAYEPAFRLDPALAAQGAITDPAPVRYDIVVADKHRDKPALAAAIAAIGGIVDDRHVGGLLLTATLTGPQLQQTLGFDQVLWINAWSAPEEDMDNARIQGGGNYIEQQAGYTGVGVNAHIYEGIEASHVDFTGGATSVRSSSTAQSHGHCTGGIVFGNGASNPAVRGMAPDAGKFYTNYSTVSGSRWQVFDDLVNIHEVSHTTASWGDARTFFYNATSADSDDIVFDHDLAWTQSQSNAGNQDSRPQAWAKNVFSIGAVDHFDDSNPNNDSWQSGNASIGPASDGRIKPTLCAYYDQIGTSDRTGGSGYSSGNWYSNFGGTSGATPIVAGHNVIAIEMYTDEVIPGFGAFGNQLRVPGGTSHENRPHFPTLKALQVVNARQYSFTSSSNDNRREHQGWGFPNLQDMWDARDRTFIVDETDVMLQGQVRSHAIDVLSNEPSLKICLNWNEPAGNPAAAQHLVNDPSLRVTSPSGTVYWGNNGLEDGVWSVAGGSEDSINSIECVFVNAPESGLWNVEVLATAIVQDNHVETPAVDADYSLVVRGGQGSQTIFASFTAFGEGCDSSVVIPTPPCFEKNGSAVTTGNQTGSAERAYWITTAGGPLSIDSVEFLTRSTGGTVTVPVNVYTGTPPSGPPILTTTMTIGPNTQWYSVDFAQPLLATTTVMVSIDTSGLDVVYPEVPSGSNWVAYERQTPTGPWNIVTSRTAMRVICSPLYDVPVLGNTGLPVLGTSYDVELDNALPQTFAVAVTGLSDETYSGGSLPVTLPGTTNCNVLVSPDAFDAYVTTGAGTATHPFSVPNSSGLAGVAVYHQWVVLDAQANAAGLVTTNAGRARVGN